MQAIRSIAVEMLVKDGDFLGSDALRLKMRDQCGDVEVFLGD